MKITNHNLSNLNNIFYIQIGFQTGCVDLAIVQCKISQLDQLSVLPLLYCYMPPYLMHWLKG